MDVEQRPGGVKKLWVIVGPDIFDRINTNTMNVVTKAFSGHLGDLELTAIAMANTVGGGFNYGFMVTFTVHTSSTSLIFHSPFLG